MFNINNNNSHKHHHYSSYNNIVSLNIILIFCLFHFWVWLDNMEGFQPYYNFDCDGRMLNLAYNKFAIFQNWRSIKFFCWSGLPASTVFHVCPLSNYTFMCKHDPQDHKVLRWFMKGYQPYSTFVEEGILPQQSLMFSYLQIIHFCTNMNHITIMFLCDIGRATSHIQHLLKRAPSSTIIHGLLSDFCRTVTFF